VIFKQFYLSSLGHASYFVGSEETGEALVLDVRRDVDHYFEEARAHGMRIAYAADTHQHNDYVTGICELPLRGDVQLLASARAQLGYATRSLADGERLQIGEIVFEAIHTPGHTPEHMALLVTDRSRGDEPALLLSGGALLVGDVARPDLLGTTREIEQHTSDLFRTLREKILTLPDFVEVYPTHVAGSLCGGHIASRLSTTIGYERRMNRLLGAIESGKDARSEYTDLSRLPSIPPYWRRMRALNVAGPPTLGVLREPPALSVDEFDRARGEGAIVLDARSPEAFAQHIPRAINAGLGDNFPTWAGSVLPAAKPYLLVLEHPSYLWEVCWHLLRIGFDLPTGWLSGGMRAWVVAGKPVESLAVWSAGRLRDEMRHHTDLVVVDVRQPSEWFAGHIRGARHIPGAKLLERMSEIPRSRTVATVCSSGYRSTVAASALQREGYTSVVSLAGGMPAWRAAGFETVRDDEVGAVARSLS
jgi:hydroxyacylglutathione hydrolase